MVDSTEVHDPEDRTIAVGALGGRSEFIDLSLTLSLGAAKRRPSLGGDMEDPVHVLILGGAIFALFALPAILAVIAVLVDRE